MSDAKDSLPPGKDSVTSSGQHKNDMYGNIDARSEQESGVAPPIPAATVVLLRDVVDAEQAGGIEVLMLQKNTKITFGGMWVFPGGKIDPEDHREATDDHHAAQIAAARETAEETGLEVAPGAFAWFAHWTPPPGPQKRFSTWFFAAHIDEVHVGEAMEVAIDQGEIKDAAWISPTTALNRHAEGAIDLVPPTWVTLHHLSRFDSAQRAVEALAAQEARYYATRVVKDATGTRVALWEGDAGYDSWDAEIAGPRHRLVMAENGFEFINTAVSY